MKLTREQLKAIVERMGRGIVKPIGPEEIAVRLGEAIEEVVEEPHETNQKTPVQGGATEEQIEAAARALACLEPDEDWPTNVELGGSPTGTRDDDYRDGMRDTARDALEAAAAVSVSASAHPADEPHDADDQVRGEAIREVAEHLDRTLKSGLVAKFYVLSTMEAAASRMERGMNAHGDVRQPRPKPRDSADDSLAAAFEQMRDEYDGYRHAVRVGVQRVRDVAARVQVATASEVLESLAYIGMPPELVPTRMIGERHDAEERAAKAEDHAATVTPNCMTDDQGCEVQ